MYRDSRPESQTLLIPEVVDLPQSEGMLIREHLEVLSRTGLEVEHFGGDTFVIKSVPTALSNKNIRGWSGTLRRACPCSQDKYRRAYGEALSRMACFCSGRRDYMNTREIAALLVTWINRLSSNCPHE
jgi:DNA mismatch repair protein MutL